MNQAGIKYKGKIIGTTQEGIKRELELLNDKCLSCVHNKLYISRYCYKRHSWIYDAVAECIYYTNTTLDKYLKVPKGEVVKKW